MKKFPVISNRGIEYEVELYYGDSLGKAGLNVIIRKQTVGFLGKVKMKEVRHFNEFRFINQRETLEKNSYVDLVKMYVDKYEEDIKDDIEYSQRKLALKKEFELWDGKC